jgi:hypothetical protein
MKKSYKAGYRVKKALTFGCACVMGLGLLTGCGSSTSGDSTSNVATATDAATVSDAATATDAVPFPELNPEEVVLTVGYEEITEEEVMVYILMGILDGQHFYKYISEDEDTYKDTILTTIRETKILYAHALENEMDFGDDDLETVDTLIQSFKDNVGEDVISDYGISDDMITKVITESSYVSKLENDTQNELGQSLTAKYDEEYADYNFQTVYYMVFPTIEEDENGDPKQDDDGNYIPLDDAAKADAKAKAEAAMAEVNSGKDAEEVAADYGVDSYSDDKAGLKGQYSSVFNDALGELSEGQATGIYESSTGYYFVTLLTDDDQDMKDSYIYLQVSDEVDAAYEEKKQEWMDKVTIDDENDLKNGIWENFSLLGVAYDLNQRGLLN